MSRNNTAKQSCARNGDPSGSRGARRRQRRLLVARTHTHTRGHTLAVLSELCFKSLHLWLRRRTAEITGAMLRGSSLSPQVCLISVALRRCSETSYSLEVMSALSEPGSTSPHLRARYGQALLTELNLL